MELLELPPEDIRWVQNQLQHTRICLIHQELDAAENWAAKVEETARQQDYKDALAEVLTSRSLIATARGDLILATELLKEAEEVARQCVGSKALAACHVAMATVLVRRGEFERSAEYSRSALQIFQASGDLKGAGHAHRSVALYLRDQGRYEEDQERSMLHCRSKRNASTSRTRMGFSSRFFASWMASGSRLRSAAGHSHHGRCCWFSRSTWNSAVSSIQGWVARHSNQLACSG